MRVRALAITVTAATVAGFSLSGRSGAVQAQSGPTGPTTIVATGGAALRGWDQTIDSMSRAGDLRVRRVDQDSAVAERTHERMDQYYKGVRVRGGDIVRQTERGSTVSIFGSLQERITLDVTPTLSADDALAIAERESGVGLGPRNIPKLLILPHDGAYRLVYTTSAFTFAGAFQYFIDAVDGSIVLTLDAAQRQATAIGLGTGVLGDAKKVSVSSRGGAFEANDLRRPPQLLTFNMREDITRTLNFLNGVIALGAADLATDTDNNWTDVAAVDAHAYAGYVYDYYFLRHQRRGLDNNNFRILSLVHPASRSAVFAQPLSIVDLFYTNAFYVPGEGVMVYGEGLPPGVTRGGKQWNYVAGALDIVAHELTHGVTEFTSGLLYENESGALNESFSDMMATAVEFYYQSLGSGILRGDYSIGEDVVTPGGARSMSNPASFGDPDHYSQRIIVPLSVDHGGVHANSGIPNHVYYLAIEGGINRTSGSSVQGVGFANREQIEKVMYRAFTQMMPSNSTFSVARAATIQAARDLYPSNAAVVNAVTQAWTAVGVN